MPDRAQEACDGCFEAQKIGSMSQAFGGADCLLEPRHLPQRRIDSRLPATSAGTEMCQHIRIEPDVDCLLGGRLLRSPAPAHQLVTRAEPCHREPIVRQLRRIVGSIQVVLEARFFPVKSMPHGDNPPLAVARRPDHHDETFAQEPSGNEARHAIVSLIRSAGDVRAFEGPLLQSPTRVRRA